MGRARKQIHGPSYDKGAASVTGRGKNGSNVSADNSWKHHKMLRDAQAERVSRRKERRNA
jgi:hypothetical protein